MWVDRYNLLRRLAPPPRSPDALIGTVLTVVLPVAIMLHVVCTLVFYSRQLGVVRADPLCSWPPAAAPGSGPHGGLPAASGAGDTGARCQTPHTLRQAEDAVAICWASLLLWASLVAVYVAREALRRTDRGIHLYGGSTVAKYVDVLTVQEPAGHDGLLHEPRSTAFKAEPGLTLYLPPLPQFVVHRLGIVCTDSRARRASVSVVGQSFSNLPLPVA